MIEKRWNEIFFFYICDTFLQTLGTDYNMLFDIITGLAGLGQYDAQDVKRCAYLITTNANVRPTLMEICFIGREVKVSEDFMRKLTKLKQHQRNVKIEHEKKSGIAYSFLARLDKIGYNNITRFNATILTLINTVYGSNLVADWAGPVRFMR